LRFCIAQAIANYRYTEPLLGGSDDHRKSRLSVEEQAIVRGITNEEIESLLGFKQR